MSVEDLDKRIAAAKAKVNELSRGPSRYHSILKDEGEKYHSEFVFKDLREEFEEHEWTDEEIEELIKRYARRLKPRGYSKETAVSRLRKLLEKRKEKGEW